MGKRNDNLGGLEKVVIPCSKVKIRLRLPKYKNIELYSEKDELSGNFLIKLRLPTENSGFVEYVLSSAPSEGTRNTELEKYAVYLQEPNCSLAIGEHQSKLLPQ